MTLKVNVDFKKNVEEIKKEIYDISNDNQILANWPNNNNCHDN